MTSRRWRIFRLFWSLIRGYGVDNCKRCGRLVGGDELNGDAIMVDPFQGWSCCCKRSPDEPTKWVLSNGDIWRLGVSE
jgi:hypothetical protein